MKKLMKLCMKEGSTVSGHLNEFNSLFSQLTSQGFNEFDDKLKSIFLLCSLPSSWDRFCTAIRNSAPNGKSFEGSSHGDAYTASSPQKQRGRDRYAGMVTVGEAVVPSISPILAEAELQKDKGEEQIGEPYKLIAGDTKKKKQVQELVNAGYTYEEALKAGVILRQGFYG
ncbi:hypothetical protein L7F22_028827 [Adiantum nelumboides]|nr:hypothetical protein [Adiantum nelumboides]